MTRWEYLQLAWWIRLQGEGENATWMQSAAIFDDGHEPEDIMVDRPVGEGWNPLEIISNLGYQGWELVTLEVRHGAYVPGQGQGYHATPIERRWWFNRPNSL